MTVKRPELKEMSDYEIADMLKMVELDDEKLQRIFGNWKFQQDEFDFIDELEKL